MKSKIIKLIFGESVIRHYASVSIAGNIMEHVYLQTGADLMDITQNQWLLSLDPVVMGVWIEKKFVIPGEVNEYTIFFTDKEANNESLRQNTVAAVTLELLDKIEESHGTLFLLKAKKSILHHISFWKIALLFFKFYRKPGLSFAQFKSLAATHSYPRRVRVISFKEGNYYNIFPMDLLGDLSTSNRFVFGLRHSNHALPKIMQSKKIVVSEFDSSYKDIVYQLGKHHTTEPLSMDALPFRTTETERFQFFIPEWVESYHEINIIKTINLGSHMLLWGEPVYKKTLTPASAHLFHIPFLLYLHQKEQSLEYPQV